MEAQAQGSVSLLDEIVEQGHMARTEEQKSYAQDLIGEFVRQVTDGDKEKKKVKGKKNEK